MLRLIIIYAILGLYNPKIEILETGSLLCCDMNIFEHEIPESVEYFNLGAGIQEVISGSIDKDDILFAFPTVYCPFGGNKILDLLAIFLG